MKAIIFDVDNTLIDWKDEYIDVLKKILVKHGFNFSDKLINQINSAIDDDSKNHSKLSDRDLLDYINQTCNTNLSAEVIKELKIAQGKLSYLDEDVRSTIEYLSKKYDLYIVSDWYTKTQKDRLKIMKIKKFFKKIYGADENYYKYSKRAYDIILKSYNPHDCLSVGDNLDCDIIIPSELGMNVIWKTNEKSDKYTTIKSIKELKDIL